MLVWTKTDGTTESLKKSGVCIASYKPLSYIVRDGGKYIDNELIFPPELLLRKVSFLNLNDSHGLKWYRPLSVQHVLELKTRYLGAKLVIGNTEVGIEMRLKRMQYNVLISVAQVPELNILNVKDDGLEMGATVRLSELLRILKRVSGERPAHQISYCTAIVEQIKWFTGTQVKNVASVGGNICTPISNLNPLWMAAGAKFEILDSKANIRIVLAENFFLGYHKIDLASNEISLSIHLPWTRPFEYVKEFNQAHRRDDDIALVHLEKRDEEWLVVDASIVYGGVAAVTFSASKTKDFIIGKCRNKELLGGALKVLEEDVVLKEDAPGGMVEFRRSLILSFFFKFFLWVCEKLDVRSSLEETISPSDISALQPSEKSSVIGSQDYEIVKHGTSVGSPEIHQSATLQVTGEAEYADDLPTPPSCLHAALILSQKPRARLVSINDAGAKSSHGFAGIFFVKDIPGDNHIGTVFSDEELYASELVTCVGQVIGVVVADTYENANLAARRVHVEYEELLPYTIYR